MYTVAITGASGPIIGIRLIEELLKSGKETSVVVSDAGWKTINYELFKNEKDISAVAEILKIRNFTYNKNNLKEYTDKDFFSPIASGSSHFNAFIAAPASMKTVSAIAHGYADSLITRAADVALKENRKCILIPRETPLSLIHLDNMQRAKNAGADIVMPVPGFYTFPETIEDVVNFIVGKVLNLLEIENSLIPQWGSNRE